MRFGNNVLCGVLAALVLPWTLGARAYGGEEATMTKGSAGGRDVSLWYRKPAGDAWVWALPLGNGRLGTMVFGSVDEEHLLFNEDSLWSGWAEPDNDRSGAFEALERARPLIRDGKTKEGSKILLDEFCSLHGYGKPDFGAYQAFCDAWIKTGHPAGEVSDYRRELDLQTAVATVSYACQGVQYRREYFCSHPDQVSVMHVTADRPGQVNLSLRLTSPHTRTQVRAEGTELVLSGQVDTGKGGSPGLRFEARFAIRATGGTVAAAGGTLRVSGADDATILMTGATDYRLAYPNYRGEPPAARNAPVLKAALAQSYAQLRARHIADHQALFNRVSLELGTVGRSDLPTDERLKAYKAARDDRGLEALVFQYGRYLMIASSRPGGMPANLQGLWNNSNRPPWNCDYHLNINMQMNYWPVDSCNLSECALPMIQWADDLRQAGAKTARVHYHAGGWVVHHTANVWGFTSPGPRRGVHMLEAESGAFLCQNLWDHYAYTQDRDYLENTAWPILRGAAEFWADTLQEVEGGYLAVNPSYSPEHGPLSDGAYYQTMIIWDLFGHCIEACNILGRDAAFRERLAGLRERLQPPRIGQYGELCEWRDPALEKNANRDRHRHVSHLYAVYPGHQIVPGRDPDLTQAAIKSMNFRGDAATGWSMGWKVNLWARLRDGDRAMKLMGNLIAGKLYPNLWDSCPPFQIDGNFGYTAGVAEMLLQSHERVPQTGLPVLRLLPALPAAWSDGEVHGLRARGGFEVAMCWGGGKLVNATIKTGPAGRCRIGYGAHSRDVDLPAGGSVTLGADLRSVGK